MKYQSAALFRKHLDKSFPHHLEKIYFIVVKDDYERFKFINDIISYLPKDNALAVSRYSTENLSIQKVVTELDSLSLFGDSPIIVLDEINQYKTKDLQVLINYLKTNSLNSFLILAAKEKKDLLTVFSEVDKKGVILDLGNEKPWDKEKRLSAFVVEKCAQAKKTITNDAVKNLVLFCDFDMSSVENEIAKITIYLKDCDRIETADILKISGGSKKINAWQMAEKILLTDTVLSFNDCFFDASFFRLILSAFRYVLREGLKNSLKRKNKEIVFSENFFKKALELLPEMEKRSREGEALYLPLICLFSAKIKLLQKYDQNHFVA